jgi:hypothetical protein
MIDLLHLLPFLRLQHMKHVFVYLVHVFLVHVFFVRDGGDDFPWFAAGDGGDCAEVDNIIAFGAPWDVVDVGELVWEVGKGGERTDGVDI